MPPMPVLSKRWEYVEDIFAFRILKDSRRHFSHLLAGQEAFRWMSHQSLAHQSGSKGWTNVNKLNNKFIAIHCRRTRFDSFCRSQHNTAMPPFLPDFWPSFAFSKGTVAFGCCHFQMPDFFMPGIWRFGNPVTFASWSTRHWAHPGRQLQIHNGSSQNQVPPQPWWTRKNQRMKRQTQGQPGCVNWKDWSNSKLSKWSKEYADFHTKRKLERQVLD